MVKETVLFWFRRDLRLYDNHGLYKALVSGKEVQPVFVFDKAILENLPKDDKRVNIIYNELKTLQDELREFNASLDVRYGDVIEVMKDLVNEYEVDALYCNEDYEPYAINRDQKVSDLLKKTGIGFYTFTDQVIFRPDKVLKQDGKPYSVYTPYSRQWISVFNSMQVQEYPSQSYLHRFKKTQGRMLQLEHIGFEYSKVDYHKSLPSAELLNSYDKNRDIPSCEGTSRLGVALRFGLVSIRQLVQYVIDYPKYLNELIWREFYMMVLFHHPHVVTRSFKSKYDDIPWLNREDEFELWKNGQTGYPIVDAGMRQLNETGYMHNRVRMITASFLTKHLLVDWRWGEAYFALKLNDYELSSNNGGWQWAAGSGCDAAPYFRVFNPTEQTRKFDPQFEYIKKWVPEFSSFNYASPVVEHRFARERALKTYKTTLK